MICVKKTKTDDALGIDYLILSANPTSRLLPLDLPYGLPTTPLFPFPPSFYCTKHLSFFL